MPCVFELASELGPVTSTRWAITNSGPSNVELTYAFPVPTKRKGRSLYLDGIRIGIRAANPTNYVSKIAIRGCRFNEKEVIFRHEGNWNSMQRAEMSLNSLNCSSFDEVKVILFLECSERKGVKVPFVTMKHHFE